MEDISEGINPPAFAGVNILLRIMSSFITEVKIFGVELGSTKGVSSWLKARQPKGGMGRVEKG